MAKRSFGEISRLPSGRYRARYTGPDNDRHSAPQTFATKEEAEGWLSQVRRSIDLATWMPPRQAEKLKQQTSLTVATLFSSIVNGDYPETTRNTYRSIYRNRIEAYLGDAAVSATTRQDINEWWQLIKAKHPTTHKRNSDSYALLSLIFNTAVDREIIETSPVRVKNARKKPEPKQKPHLTTEELTGIIAAAPSHYRVAILVAASCALRIGEWSALQRQDVEVIDQGDATPLITLHISRAIKERTKGEKYVGTTKTGRSRTVSVPSHVIPSLLAHMEAQKNKNITALLFPNARGEVVDRRRFNVVLKRAGKTVNRGDISSHSLRHAGATEYARAGATLKEIMQRLGHSTVTSALRYQTATQQRDREVASRMATAALDPGAIAAADKAKAEARKARAEERKKTSQRAADR